MLVGDDPVEAGLVASLTKPGGNLTGLSSFQPDLVGKRLQMLQEVVPRLSRVAVLGHARDPMVGRAFDATEKTAGSAGLSVQTYKVAEPEELEDVFANIAAARPQGLLVLQNFWAYRNREKIIQLADPSIRS
jgi:putative ABC transport system substrate-binding protein